MPHKALIDAMLWSHTVIAQIRAQQATSNDLGQDAHMAAAATCNNIPYMQVDARARLTRWCTDTVVAVASASAGLVCPLLHRGTLALIPSACGYTLRTSAEW